MRPAKVLAGRWIGLLVIAAYPFLMHAMLIFADRSLLGTIVILAGLVVVALIAILQFKRSLALVLAVVGAGAAAVVFHSAPSGVIVAASGIPHAATNAALLMVFGRSLLPGRKPLITTVSEKLNGGSLAPDIDRYTRSVTLVWCCFFALELVASLLLLLFAPVAVWSLFVNVLTLPLVVAMFLCEYAYRRLRFRSQPHRTILQVIEVFSAGEVLKRRPITEPTQQ